MKNEVYEDIWEKRHAMGMHGREGVSKDDFEDEILFEGGIIVTS